MKLFRILGICIGAAAILWACWAMAPWAWVLG